MLIPKIAPGHNGRSRDSDFRWGCLLRNQLLASAFDSVRRETQTFNRERTERIDDIASVSGGTSSAPELGNSMLTLSLSA